MAAITCIPASWFRPNRAVYWTDILVAASVGWLAFAALVAADGRSRLWLFPVATFALYRAVPFIHELTHVNGRDLPHFELAWNALVGVPLLVPSFLYHGVHLEHHRQKTYGTARDPEYVPFARRSPMTLVRFLVGASLLPIALIVRFGLLAPASWTSPPASAAGRRAVFRARRQPRIRPGDCTTGSVAVPGRRVCRAVLGGRAGVVPAL